MSIFGGLFASVAKDEESKATVANGGDDLFSIQSKYRKPPPSSSVQIHADEPSENVTPKELEKETKPTKEKRAREDSAIDTDVVVVDKKKKKKKLSEPQKDADHAGKLDDSISKEISKQVKFQPGDLWRASGKSEGG